MAAESGAAKPAQAFRGWHVPGAFVAGVALNGAFAPLGGWPLAILAPAALFTLIRPLTPRDSAWTGAAFGAGLFTFGTYWLYTAIHGFGLAPVWLTLVLQAGLVAIMAAYLAALCYVATRFWSSGATRDWLVLPALWIMLEWLRSWLLSGFPWLGLGYAFIDAPLAGWAPLLGVYGVTAAAAFSAAAVSVLLLGKAAGRRRLTAAIVIAGAFAAPLLLSRISWTHSVADPFPVAVVQGAVPQDQKWLASNRDETIGRYSTLTAQSWGARLIVWPEAALPELANDLTDYLDTLQTVGRAHHADFAIGLVNHDPQTGAYYNGVRVISDAGSGWYYKRHLVPFGEYFPVPDFVRAWMRLMSLPYDDMTPGADDQPTLSAAGQKLGLTICYEDAYGSAQLPVLQQATLLINVTNNAWYGDSTAPHQHLQIARMRALEAGRYLVRAANDGITAVIGPQGQIVARLPQFKEGVLRSAVQPMAGLTPYARFGNYPVIGGASLLLFVAIGRRRRSG
jgi:apolipoprotein N-acyltransferase